MRLLLCDYKNVMEEDYTLTIRAIRQVLPEAEVIICPFTDKEALYRALVGVEGMITAFLPLDEEFFAHAADLKCVSVNAAGYGNVNLAAARAHDVKICHIAEYCTQEVAEHTFALILALNRNLKYYGRRIEKQKEWRYASIAGGRTLSSQTLAIFGFGKIGRRVAQFAKGFGMEVLAVDPFLPPEIAQEAGAKLVTAGEAFARADIITNHMNLTEENYHFFGEETFRKMEKKPLFVNVGRGACVDEAALIKALDEGLIRGAGLDVLEAEEPDLANSPLLGRENVVLTPHSAFYSKESMDRLQIISGENLAYALTGQDEKVKGFVPGKL